MKVWHIRSGRPIGPWFECFLERPTAFDEPNDCDPYGTWVEEVDLDVLCAEFAALTAYMQANGDKPLAPAETRQLVLKQRYGL